MSWARSLAVLALVLVPSCVRPAATRNGAGAVAPWWRDASTRASARAVPRGVATTIGSVGLTSAERREAEREFAGLPPWRRAQAHSLRRRLASHYFERGRQRLARGAFEAAAADWRRAELLGAAIDATSAAQLAFRLALQAGNDPVEASARRAAMPARLVADLPPAEQALARTWLAWRGDGAMPSPAEMMRLSAWLLGERYMRLGYRLASRIVQDDLALAQFRAWYRGELDLVPAMCALARPIAPSAAAAPAGLEPWHLLVAHPIAGEAAARARCDRAIDDGACAFEVGVALLRAHQPRRAARWFAYAHDIDGDGTHQAALAATMGRALAEALGGNLDGAEQWLLVAETAAREPVIVSAALAHATAAYGHADGKAHALFRYWVQRLHPRRDIDDVLRRAHCDQ